jgi:penicillin-binding protein 2B
MKKHKTVKISIIFLLAIVASFIMAIIKMTYVAVSPTVDGVDIEAFAKNRNTTKKTLYASRGTIYDANGEILGQSVNSYTVIAYLSDTRTTDTDNPKQMHVEDSETTAKKLAEVFQNNGIPSMTYDHILELLKTKNRYQVELGPGGRNITELVKSQIEDLNLPGIDFVSSTKRYYKMATLAPYIVGYAKENDDGKLDGEMGIEKYFNDTLTGSDGYSEYETDVYGYKLPNSPENTKEPTSGSDIYLTIDSNIQMFLEQAVSSLASDYKMSWLTFTIADAKTGAILGSASNPTFNLNKLDMTSYLDPLVSYQYEPGSTMKMYSFMAAMENGLYDGSETYQSGTVTVDDATIKDFNGVGWGRISFDEGFAYSSNVAATYLSFKLGADKLRTFYETAGFGKKTGITLPGEVEGNISFNYKTEVATASFGQGITTTPIQNIQGLTLIANDGVELQPYIVDKIVDTNTGKVTYKGGRTEIGQVASKSTTDKIRSLMYDVVYSGKTDAKFYKPNNVSMIGKTGTAQITGDSGQYLTGKYDYIRSFAGMFPAEDPKYIIYISAKQFVGPITKVAEAVKQVVEEVAKYKNIVTVETSVDASQIICLNSYLNTATIDTEKNLKYLKLVPIVIGDGKYIVNQYPDESSKILVNSKVFLITNGNTITMPDITGWSESEATTLCHLLKLNYVINGYGVVKSYSIPANTTINAGDAITIELG